MMETRHWDTCSEVERDPEKVGGARVFRDTRLPLSALYEHLASGATIGEIAQWLPGVEEAQLRTVLEHDAQTLKKEDGW